MRNPLYAFVLDEISLAPFLMHAILGHEIALVAVRPVFPPARRMLLWVANRWISRARVCWAIDYVPELNRDWRWDRNLYFRNAYGKYESWQDSYFGLPRPDGETDAYEYAFNHLTANHVYDKAIEIYVMEALDRNLAGRHVVKIGMTHDTAALYAARFQTPVPCLCRRLRIVDLGLNVVISIIIILTTAIWMIRRLRLQVRPENVFCIVDRLGNRQEEFLIDALRDGGEIVSFNRSPAPVSGREISWGEGSLNPMGFVAGLLEMIGHVWRLWRRHGALTARHFYIVAGLPRKALLWRCLFNVYRPEHFFGRDEYNSDHILRGRELARIGAVSHGISGAVYSAYTDVAPNSRYVAFDHIYVAGTKVIISDRWRKEMKIHPVGSWGFRADRFDAVGPPGDDILISIRIAFENEEMIRITHAIATAFPDRNVILQMKPITFLTAAELERLVELYRGDHPNIVLSDESIYDLVERAKFHISDISTLVAESIHRGAYCFVADVLGHETCCYRDFPGLCVGNAAEAVSRLRDIEDGVADYPRDTYMTLLGLPAATNPFDVFRENVGLAALPSCSCGR